MSDCQSLELHKSVAFPLDYHRPTTGFDEATVLMACNTAHAPIV